MRRQVAIAVAVSLVGGIAEARPKKKAKRKRATPALRKGRYQYTADATTSAAYRYGMLADGECLAELAKRKIAVTRETAFGVKIPVRLATKLHGIEFRTNESATARKTTRYEIGDCRLILALDDFAALLCEAVGAHLFNVVLTPNHDRPHHNHFHLEVTAGKTWFLTK